MLLVAGCDRSESATPTTRPTRIVSLTPAGSNLILEMGLGNKLAGVSAYDSDPAVKNLPKVGDYQRIDWEQLAQIKPTHLLVQGKIDRLPPGIQEHSRELGIEVINLQIDRLNDIYSAIDQIGKSLSEAQKSAQMIQRIKGQLTKATHEPTPAMIMIGGEGKLLVGQDNYLNDLLELAGGSNVIRTNGYVNIDAELAATLRPQVIFILASGDKSIDTKSLVLSSDNWPAVKNHRIFVFSDNLSLLPGACVTRVYDYFVQHLIPGATTQP